MMTIPASVASWLSNPVPIIGFEGYKSGTACLCMFDPIRALLASSCSRKGIKDDETETN